MNRFFQNAETAAFRSGEIICVDNTVNLVRSGTVAVYSLRGSQRTFMYMYKAGEFFPYSQRQYRTRRYEFVALTKTVVSRLPRKSFEAELDKLGDIRPLVDGLLKTISLQTERMENYSRRRAREKVIERLNFLVERAGKKRQDKILIDSMTHADIASSIGTTRETTTRIIKKLEKEGLLSVRRRGILILAPERLKDLSAS